MKHTILVASALLCMTCLQAQTKSADSQTSDIQRHQLLLSPFHLFAGTFMVSYERYYPSYGSLRITPSFTLSNLFDDETREGVGLDIGYKVFLLSKYKINVYMGPYVMYKYRKRFFERDNISYDGVHSSGSYHIWGLGIDTGVKFTFGRFTMDVTAGGGIRYPKHNSGYKYSSSSIFDDYYKGVAPRVNFSLGIVL